MPFLRTALLVELRVGLLVGLLLASPLALLLGANAHLLQEGFVVVGVGCRVGCRAVPLAASSVVAKA